VSVCVTEPDTKILHTRMRFINSSGL